LCKSDNAEDRQNFKSFIETIDQNVGVLLVSLNRLDEQVCRVGEINVDDLSEGNIDEVLTGGYRLTDKPPI
jgi:hypothetical protein